jgi:hypothetical protein
MTHAARRHRVLDAELAERLARDVGKPLPSETVSSGSGDNVPDRNIMPSHGGALLPSRSRLRDLRTMSKPRVLLTKLSIRTSAKGNTYLSGRLGQAKPGLEHAFAPGLEAGRAGAEAEAGKETVR